MAEDGGIRFTPKIHHNRLKYKKTVFFVCDILCDKMCDKFLDRKAS